MEWLKQFIKEAEEMPDVQIMEIEEPVGKNEIVVGSGIPKSLKKFKTLINEKHFEIFQRIYEHNRKHEDPNYDGSECDKVHRFVKKRVEEIRILNKIFWKEVEESISYRKKEPGKTIGIRKNWTIVELEDKDELEEIINHTNKVMDLFPFEPWSVN